MAVLFSDDFNRADNSIVSAANWAENAAGDWAIASNALSATPGSPPSMMATTTTAHAAVADCKASITVPTATGFDGGPGVRLDADGSGQGYFLDVYNSAGWKWEIYKSPVRAGSGGTQIGTTYTGTTLANGSKISIEAEGTGATVTLRVYHNDSLIFTRTDSSSPIVSAGQAGLYVWASTTVDSFILEDLAAAAGQPSGGRMSGVPGARLGGASFGRGW